MNDTIIKTLESLDFGALDQDSASIVADVLLKKIPGITGLIEKAAKDKQQALQDKFKSLKENVAQGTGSVEQIETLIVSLSEQYTHILSQLGVIETQLEQAEAMRGKLDEKAHGIRIATIPVAMLIDFVKIMKDSTWARVVWEQKPGTQSDKITDYARLVDIYVEPNVQWCDQVTFTMFLGGYLPESDYNILASNLNIRTPYNILTDRSPNKYG